MEVDRDPGSVDPDLSEAMLRARIQSVDFNSIIELHDSCIVETVVCEQTIVVRFGPAYIHRSTGRPGIDRGTVWIQHLELIFYDAVFESEFTEIPCKLDGGSLTVDGHVFENSISFPINVEGKIRFRSESVNSEKLVIVSNRIKMGSARDAVYVEDFPGSR